MHTFTSVTRRSMTLGVAVALLVATIIPAAAAYADALNPLTERSLLLTSSAPGYMNTDGSNNPETDYAPAGSGPNGQKTGQTFTFNVSTNSASPELPDIASFSFQYCTTAAGYCRAPGNNTGDARDDTRAVNGPAMIALEKSDLEAVYGNDAVYGEDFEILVGGVAAPGEWALSTWNAEDEEWTNPNADDSLTGTLNYISLVQTSGTPLTPVSGTTVQVVFKASADKYITNPGEGSFFVKLNTYSTNDPATHTRVIPASDPDQTNIVDGGVTVANVMTHSMHITTKVLETMSFSVGNKLPDSNPISGAYATCGNIQSVNDNRLDLGNPAAEFSLETGTAWDVESFWRLSSNSSGGATVYYSGETLWNTVGDRITEIGPTALASLPGTEQFGLAIVDDGVAGTEENTLIENVHADYRALVGTNPNYQMPTIEPLNREANYDGGTGEINAPEGETNDATFAFDRTSLTNPVSIATNVGVDAGVLSCTTAKMRYIANIGADTPAGVYTTKINYLAAPQY